MAQKFLTNVELEAGLVDGSNSAGTSGYLLSSTGTATSWVDPAAVSVGESEQVHIACKNTSGVAISKGDPVYITGTVGTSFRIEIAAADASNSAKMPAVGLAETDLANNAEGFVIVSGVLKNLTTDPLSTGDGTPSSNDTVYVKAGGGLTRTKPTGSGNLIQNVGKVGRVNSANAGSLAVSTIMRTNDVPNLTTGKIWVGSSTYTTESGVVHLDESSGRMGIGTTSPSHKLDVDGGAQFNTNTGTTPFYITRLGSATEALSIKVMDDNVRFESIQDESADSYGGFDFRMDGGVTEPNFVIRKNADDPILHVDGAGKVGINSTNPSSTLQVGDGTADSSFRTYYNDNTYAEVRGYGVNFNRQYSYLRPTTDNYAFLYIGSQTNTWNELYLHSNKIIFSDNTSEVMRINPGGNVGIGTTSPRTKLHISGITGDDDPSLGTSTAPLFVSNTANSYGLNVGVNNLGDAWLQAQSNTSATAYDILLNPLGGNVGIGTTSPQAKLHVANGTLRTWTPTSGTSAIFESTANSRSFVTITGANESELWFGDGTTQAKGRVRYENNSNMMEFWTNGGPRMYINSSGNVGIGTTSPSRKLSVSGAIELTTADTTLNTAHAAFRRGSSGEAFIDAPGDITLNIDTNNNQTVAKFSVTKDGGTEIFRVQENGNVGIGTTAPGQKLTIDQGVGNVNQGIPATSGSTQNGILRLQPGGPYGESFDFGMNVSTTYAWIQPTNKGNHSVNYNLSLNPNGGNVGIGTTSPAQKLHVDGNIRVGDTNDVIYADKFFTVSNANLHIGANNGYDTVFFNGPADERMRITSSGNVGIGTTSPNQKLTIKGTDQYVATEQTDYVWGGTNTIGVRMGTDATAGALDFRRWTGSATLHGNALITQVLSDGGWGLDFRVDNKSTNTSATTSRMFISTSGEVGIGTTSPNQKLEVAGSTRITGSGLDVGYGNNGTNYIQIGNGRTTSGAAYIDLVGDTTYTDNGLRIIRNGSGANTSSELIHRGTGIFNFNATQAGSITFRTSNIERVRVDSSGNVGIGTTSPNRLLTVQTTSTGGYLALNSSSNNTTIGSDVNGAFIVYDDTAAAYRMVIKPTTGNVGIGTTSPSPIGTNITTLDIQGSSGGGFRFGRTDGIEGGLWTISSGTTLGSISSIPLYFRTGNQNRAAILANGNFGIGTTSPSTKMHVRETTQGSTAMTVQVNPDIFAGAGLINFLNNGGSTVGSIFYNGTSTSYNTSSDYRLKENVVEIQGASERLKQLKPVRFNFIHKPETEVDGFIAHEVQEVIPEAIVGQKDEVDQNGNPKYQGIDQSKIVPLLTAALQEAISKIEILENRLQILENK